MDFRKPALVLLASLAGTGVGHAYCPVPSAPSCVNGYAGFTDQWDFDICRRDVENFGSETDDYIQCLQRELQRETQSLADEAQSSADAAIAEYKQAVEDFNDRADAL